MPQIIRSQVPQPSANANTQDRQRTDYPEMEQLAERDAVTSRLRQRKAELDEDLDAFLDELEDLLAETDAQAFVANYVQKGGQ